MAAKIVERVTVVTPDDLLEPGGVRLSARERAPVRCVSTTEVKPMRASFGLIRAALADIEAVDINNGRFALLPEHELMLAILEDAIGCYMNYVGCKTTSRRPLFEDAERWFFRENEDWIFSFVNICRTVGLNPDYLRRGLQNVTRVLGASPARYRLSENHSAAGGHACSECAAARRKRSAIKTSPAVFA